MGKRTQTSQSVNTIDIHRTTATNALSATPSESECRVNLILNSDKSIQHHRARLVEIKRVALHTGFGSWLIGVPAVDLEGLDFGIGVRGWFLDCAGLGRRSNRCEAADEN